MCATKRKKEKERKGLDNRGCEWSRKEKSVRESKGYADKGVPTVRESGSASNRSVSERSSGRESRRGWMSRSISREDNGTYRDKGLRNERGRARTYIEILRHDVRGSDAYIHYVHVCMCACMWYERFGGHTEQGMQQTTSTCNPQKAYMRTYIVGRGEYIIVYIWV